MTVSQAFIEHCHAKAARFLKSVVIVDDRITWNSAQNPTALSATRPSMSAAIEGDEPESPTSFDEATEFDRSMVSDVDIETFTRSFAPHGIVAGFMKPVIKNENKHAIVKEIADLSDAADVLLIDWFLDEAANAGEQQKVTIDAIQSIFTKDTQSGGRVRLIVIYTAERIGTVQKDLIDALQQGAFKPELLEADPDDRLKDIPCISLEHGLLAVVSKTEIKYSVNATLQVHDIVVRLFSKLNRGLLASTALDAIAVIREKTHHLLANFSPEYDGAFVAHRCLIASPEDSEEFAERLISDEMKVAISLQRVGASGVGHGNVMHWVQSQRHPVAAQIEVLSKLYEPKDKDKKAQKLMGVKKSKETFAKFFPNGVLDIAKQSAINHFSSMSLLETDLSKLKKYSANWLPFLTLGSVLYSDNEYFLCLIARCDSVRIDARKTFPFLRIKTITNGSTFNLVIPRDGEFIQLMVMPDSDHLTMIEFDPSAGGYVEAKFDKNRYFLQGHSKTKIQPIVPFRVKLEQRKRVAMQKKVQINHLTYHESKQRHLSVDENTSKKIFEWIGELKSDKALQFSQAFATQLNRVGPDDFELLRLNAKK